MEKDSSIKTIGILTHYYGSDNYGGVLQAYALCHLLNCWGYGAEQIRLPVTCVPFGEKNSKEKKNGFLARVHNKLLRSVYGVDRICEERKISIIDFAEAKVPHSKSIYTNNTIKEVAFDYDAFITGSDQVWNTDYFVPAFFLDFVPPQVPKFSYAASIAKDYFSESEKEYFSEKLKDYVGVSVREENAVRMLEECSPVEVKCVLDPVFLLDQMEWNKVADYKKFDDVIFCYFLGSNPISRDIAISYQKKNWKAHSHYSVSFKAILKI